MDLPTEHLKALKAEVERFANRSMSTPADFRYLSEMICAKTQCAISPTTLKRIWGYQKDTTEGYKPSNYSLRALSRLIGYSEFAEFCNRAAGFDEHTSANYYGEILESNSLRKNTLVNVRWNPGRTCLLKHIFDSHFEVLETANSKLMAGDIVTCSVFVQHAPLYFQSVHRDGAPSLTYVAGMPGGVEYEIIG